MDSAFPVSIKTYFPIQLQLLFFKGVILSGRKMPKFTDLKTFGRRQYEITV